MSFQTIQGRNVFIIDIPNNPATLLPIHAGDEPQMQPYALALNSAINEGLIAEAGKYAIEVTPDGYWNVYTVNENNELET